jgi:DNA-binding CsgD family transcriptional regulator
MSDLIENQMWWAEVVPNLKRLTVRELAKQYKVKVKDLEAAIQRTGVMAESVSAEAASEATKAGRSRGDAQAKLRSVLDKIGVIADQEVADLVGVARKTVVDFRKQNGIAAYVPPGRAPRKAAAVTRKSAVAARKPGRPRKVVANAEAATETAATDGRRTSKLDAWAHLIGKQTDKEVAALANVTAENVRMYRMRRNIPAAWRTEGEAPRRGRPPGSRNKPKAPVVAADVKAPAEAASEATDTGSTRVDQALAPYLDRIGKAPDQEIAALAGVSRSAVSTYRQKHNIRAAGRGGRPPGSRNKPKVTAPVPAVVAVAVPEVTAPVSRPAVVTAASSQTSTGWAVTWSREGREQVFVVVATDPVDAARRAWDAARTHGGELVSLKAIGQVVG